jgi:plastocyanin
MNHFSAIPAAGRRPGAGPGRAPARVLVTALACACVVVEALPALAGTVVRGRLRLPATVPVQSSEGAREREAPDPRDAVIYVSEEPGAGASRLGGRAQGRSVGLERDRFAPRVTPVMVGARVRFRNRDRVFHNVFSVSPAGRFELGTLGPGHTREHRFETAGVVHLFCQLHPAAAGFVVVCPNWYFTRPDASGAYVLPPLPRGGYVVHAWHPSTGAVSRAVEVTGRGVHTLNLSL